MIKNETILVLGTTYNQFFLMEKIKNKNYNVWATPHIDLKFKNLNIDNLLDIDTSDKETLLKIVKKHRIRTVITSGSSTPIITVAYINKVLNLSKFIISYETAKNATHKDRFREILEKTKILPNGFSSSSLNKILIKSKNMKFPIIIKPADTGGGKGVIKIDKYNSTYITQAFRKSVNYSKTKKLIIEEYIEGITFATESIVINGKIYVLAIPEKILNKLNNSLTEGVFFPSNNLKNYVNIIKKINSIAINNLKINWGPVHIDMILTKDKKVYIIDIGARLAGGALTTHLIPQYLNYDLYDSVIDLSLGKLINPPKINIDSTFIFSSYFIVSKKKGVINKIKIRYDIIEKLNIIGYKILKEIGDTINTAQNDSDRIALFYFKSNSEKEMKKLNNILKNSVEIEVE